MTILQDISTASAQDMAAEIARLTAENAKLKATPQRGLSLKVSKTGGVSVYGMGRFPVTLYRGQWERLAKAMPEIEAFIQANSASLSVKAEA